MTTVARSASDRGEVVLRRRDRDRALELRVNGVFVMDTAQTSSERLLARSALALTDPDSADLTVLVGGLGLGFTLREVLSEPRVRHVVVAEIEPAIVDWHRRDLIPEVAGCLRDERVRVVVDDVRRVVASQPSARIDLLLLDVDNGPDHLVYDANAAVYDGHFLTSCHAALRPGGVVAVWSSAPSRALADTISGVFGSCRQERIPVTLGRRSVSYHLLLGRRLSP